MEELELNQSLLDGLREYMLAKKYPYNTLRTYNYTLKRIFKKYRILDKQIINKLLKEFTHQNQRAVLVLIRKYCYDNDLDFKIVIPSIERKKNKRTIKTIPISEVEVIIAAAPKPYDLMIKCIFKIGGGLRISEAIRLSWGNFRWTNWLKDRGNGGVEIRNSKGDDRFITVPKALMEELYEYARGKRLLNEFGIPIGGMLFNFNKFYKGEYKKELRQNNLGRWKDLYLQHAYGWFRHNVLKKHCEKAVGHPIRIHSLRHTRATQLLDEKNIPLEILQKLLGHKEITQTMIYAEVSNKRVFKAMEDID